MRPVEKHCRTDCRFVRDQYCNLADRDVPTFLTVNSLSLLSKVEGAMLYVPFALGTFV